MFELAVFADDMGQDLDHALNVVQELGLRWVEIRSAWGVNLMDHDEAQVRKVHETIRARGMRVPCIAAPLFKSRLQGQGQASEELFHAQQRDDLNQQMELLRRAAAIGRLLGTNLVRCFSFWRIDQDLETLWPAMGAAFDQAVRLAEEEEIVLVMENDFECNLGSGRDAAYFVERIDSPHLRLLWDPGNSFFVGETPFPTGYQAAKHLIGHVHIKDSSRDPETGEPRWVATGSGEIDLLGQLRALKADGYQGVVTMENHYTPPGGSKEDGVRQSFAGLLQLMAEVN